MEFCCSRVSDFHLNKQYQSSKCAPVLCFIFGGETKGASPMHRRHLFFLLLQMGYVARHCILRLCQACTTWSREHVRNHGKIQGGYYKNPYGGVHNSSCPHPEMLFRTSQSSLPLSLSLDSFAISLFLIIVRLTDRRRLSAKLKQPHEKPTDYDNFLAGFPCIHYCLLLPLASLDGCSSFVFTLSCCNCQGSIFKFVLTCHKFDYIKCTTLSPSCQFN